MRSRSVVGLGAFVLSLAWLVPSAGPAVHAGGGGAEGSFVALSGARAASYTLPGDMQLVRTLALDGVTYERYQQVYGPARARVLGGQVTVYRSGSGAATAVIGARYSGIAATNSVALSRADARRIAVRDVGAAGERRVELAINPATGRYFFRVETRRFATRWIHWIDARSGKVVNRYDAIAEHDGRGVKGDTKSMSGITTYHAGSGHGAKGQHSDLFSTDSRQTTFDAKNRSSLLYYVADADNHWLTSGRTSPGHPALVDAQYYANVTDDYFQARPGFNWTSCYTAMQSVAHYNKNYNNAFWNGTYTVYGDGDGITFRELSGGLDVVSHEHTHGITDCTSNLTYQDESGALNESFSDILGNSAEFYAAANGRDAAAADWWIGEDVYVPADAVPGFRNMSDPAEDADPDHYSERYTGTDDNGGVHSNSGIPNHAYYLLVNGGSNAGEARGHGHTGPAVTGIGLADAEKIFFRAFIGLPMNASMCQARKATEAQAASLFGTGSQQHASTQTAWDAVGVPTAC